MSEEIGTTIYQSHGRRSHQCCDSTSLRLLIFHSLTLDALARILIAQPRSQFSASSAMRWTAAHRITHPEARNHPREIILPTTISSRSAAARRARIASVTRLTEIMHTT